MRVGEETKGGIWDILRLKSTYSGILYWEFIVTFYRIPGVQTGTVSDIPRMEK